MSDLLTSFFGSSLPPEAIDDVKWLLIGFLAVVALIIASIAMKTIATRNVRGAKLEAGMKFGDLDKMKVSGAVSEDEAKRIRQALARQILIRTEEEKRVDRERLIMQQAAIDPDAARALLPEEYRDRKLEKAVREQGPQTLGGDDPQQLAQSPKVPFERPTAPALFAIPDDDAKAKSSAPSGSPAAPAPPKPPGSASQGTTTLGQTPPAPRAPEPAMNMRKVVEAKRGHRSAAEAAERENQPPPQGELETLLEKGAISREEYERLKKYFQ